VIPAQNYERNHPRSSVTSVDSLNDPAAAAAAAAAAQYYPSQSAALAGAEAAAMMQQPTGVLRKQG